MGFFYVFFFASVRDIPKTKIYKLTVDITIGCALW